MEVVDDLCYDSGIGQDQEALFGLTACLGDNNEPNIDAAIGRKILLT